MARAFGGRHANTTRTAGAALPGGPPKRGGAAAGFVIGALPAAALPLALRRLPAVTAVLDPLMVGGYGAPKLALAPLFILWFGSGPASKGALVAITVFFLVYFSA